MLRSRLMLCLVLWVLAWSGVAVAQTGAEGLDIERFKPTLDTQGVFLTEGGRGEKAGDLNLGFYLHYSRNPLVVSSGDDILNSLVEDRLAADFFVSMGMTDWLTLAVDVPAVFYQTGEIINETTGAGHNLASAALGDIRVSPKLTVLREESFGISMAVVVPVSLPSGDEAAFNGSNSVSAAPTLAFSRRLIDDRLLLAINLGFWLQEETDYRDLEVGHELFYRVGAGFRFADGWWALGELSAGGRLDTLFENQPEETPMEWLVGLRYHTPCDLIFNLGGAVGTLPGWGTPNFRAFAGMTWAPREHDRDDDGIADDEDRCPDKPGPHENDGCPWGDKDKDGLADNEDRCPDEAGPPDNRGCPWGDADGDGLKDNVDKCPKQAGPADNDGCPWGDADGDGVNDNVDKCPRKPGPKENGGCPWGDADEDGITDDQDKCPRKAGPAENDGCPWGDADGDGIKDKDDKCPKEAGPAENDGCPWSDTDGDGITDDKDKCPKDPEDKDGFVDQDGCPDLDNDSDGIPDVDDKCPNDPETINGVEDEDGCPDKGRQVVIVKKEKIEILQKVHFATGKATIRPDSYSLLDQVAQSLKAHPEIKKLRIDGHTDSRGSAGLNQRLSEQRAQSVRDYLIKKGVSHTRLDSQGFGESKPIASNQTPQGRETNRRVEFTILERD